MFGFDVEDSTPEEFLQKVTDALQKRELGRITKVAFEGEIMSVIFTRVGTSTLHYRIEKLPNGFKARYLDETIAQTHRGFRAEVRAKFQRLLEGLGASIYG